jgi:hypothetical protein
MGKEVFFCENIIEAKDVLKNILKSPKNDGKKGMEIIEREKVLSKLCKLSKKFGMYISFDKDQIWPEVCEAAPYLDFEKHIQVLMDGYAWILFDSEDEMLDCYERTVGDDGPTDLNPYNGSANVYVVTCSPKGELMNENT